MLLANSIQLLLLQFQHLKGLQLVNSTLGQLLGLHAHQLGCQGFALVGFAGSIAFLDQVVFVHLAHDFLVVVHLVEVKPLVLLGLLSHGSEQFALFGEFPGFLPSQFSPVL